ncbi:11690_t:CDS:2 [Racocetra fulgida]|uniref:11690_t:CDS:1 n=1 Tax=Racocetra fulgida TaxID=60492 RepID=A0A9N9FNQ8_9GLOM|nr:11690_t:CDS:2 [Racocetra fulgida]
MYGDNQQNTSNLKDPKQHFDGKLSLIQMRALERTKNALEESLNKFNENFNKNPSKFQTKDIVNVRSRFNKAIQDLCNLKCEYESFPKVSHTIAKGVATNFNNTDTGLSNIHKEAEIKSSNAKSNELPHVSKDFQINPSSQSSELLIVPKDIEIGSSSDFLSFQSNAPSTMLADQSNNLLTVLNDQPNVTPRKDEIRESRNNIGQKRKFMSSDCKDGKYATFPDKKPQTVIDALKNKRNDLNAIPPINDSLFAAMATGYCSYNDSWEILEYLGDRVIVSCLFKVAKSRYLSLYFANDIRTSIMGITTNKILAAYSISLKLNELNKMQFLPVRKSHADAFEAYFGAYFLVYGELLTCIHLDHLMTPLLNLIVYHVASGNKTVDDSYNLASGYFSMSWIRNINFLN